MSFLFSKPKIKEVSPAEAQHRLQERTAIIVDVREKREWHEGHIPDAKHVSLGKLQTRMHEIPRASAIFFVYRSGNRSTTATKALPQAGRSNAGSLTGRMQAWKQAGAPVRR